MDSTLPISALSAREMPLSFSNLQFLDAERWLLHAVLSVFLDDMCSCRSSDAA